MAAIFHNPLAQHLGFHGQKVNSPTGTERLGEDISNKEWNVTVALNMIPVIGNIIAGIIHIAQGINKGGEKNPVLIARGIAEVTVVGGLLLALADIVATIGRTCTNPALESH